MKTARVPLETAELDLLRSALREARETAVKDHLNGKIQNCERLLNKLGDYLCELNGGPFVETVAKRELAKKGAVRAIKAKHTELVEKFRYWFEVPRGKLETVKEIVQEAIEFGGETAIKLTE